MGPNQTLLCSMRPEDPRVQHRSQAGTVKKGNKNLRSGFPKPRGLKMKVMPAEDGGCLVSFQLLLSFASSSTQEKTKGCMWRANFNQCMTAANVVVSRFPQPYQPHLLQSEIKLFLRWFSFPPKKMHTHLLNRRLLRQTNQPIMWVEECLPQVEREMCKLRQTLNFDTRWGREQNIHFPPFF